MPLTITQTAEGARSWALVQQTNLANIKTFVDDLETDLSGFPAELKNLTAAEISQLENIGAVTITLAQWGYVGGADQPVKQADSPTFAGLTINGNIGVTGTVDGVDVAALKTDVDGFPDELKNLTTAEIGELANIGAVTITNTQWGYLGAQAGLSGMTDRGDPAAYDFTTVDFTTNGAWHDLDLSGVVPAGAKTVCLGMHIADNIPGVDFYLRKNGNANAVNQTWMEILVANAYVHADAIVQIDTDRKIEYWASNTTWSAIFLTVKGWWF